MNKQSDIAARKMKQVYVIPPWLDREFAKKVILQNDSKAKEASIEITAFEADSATNKGDNYASEMFRVQYSYTKDGQEYKDKKMIVKSRHGSDETNNMFSPYELYRTEIKIYKNLLPEFTKLLAEVGIKVPLAPEFLYCDMDKEVLVLEDANLRGFRTGNLQKRFCMKSAKLVLQKLAWYHASSAVYNDRNKQCLTAYTSKIFAAHIDSFTSSFDKMVAAFVGEVSSWKGYEYYVPKLELMRKNFKQLGDKTFSPIENGFNCLIHGDLWLNNILVKYQNNDENRPKDVLLIDLQIASWGSPTLDLHYFFYTTLPEEIYQNHLDELIQYYHGILSETLRKFDFKAIPTLHQLQLDYLSKHFQGKTMK